MHDNQTEQDNCSLFHEKVAADWVSHFVNNHSEILSSCDCVFIERQPPGAVCRDIEQVLFNVFRKKAYLCQPRSMHKTFFASGIKDSETRKKAIMNASSQYMNLESRHEYESYAKHNWEDDQRQHYADATCQMVHMIKKMRCSYKKSKNIHFANERSKKVRGSSLNEYIAQFKYDGPIKI